MAHDNPLRIPDLLRRDVEQILEFADPFCGELTNKAKLIRDILRIGQMDPEFCRRELLASNPMAWMISVNGFIVDARTMPPEVQAEALRRGLIPDLPGPVGQDAGETAGGGRERR